MKNLTKIEFDLLSQLADKRVNNLNNYSLELINNVKKELKLSERKYVCDECGFEIDRDYNAAINLMRYKV